MRMTVQTDYALRVLMQLAVTGEQRTIDEIAQAYGISRNHVMKVVQRLAMLGIVDSQRGRNGGLRLARPADEINVGALVRQMEDTSQFVECFDSGTNQCVVTPACGLKHALSGAVEQFLVHLDRFTVADLVRKPVDFGQLLGEETLAL
ncbi:MAG: RrF2 family transcriptional regulator [Parasphingopyxis sp.]